MSRPRPSLLAVCAVAHPGGAEEGLLRLLARLADRGWTGTVTAPAPGAVSERAAALGWATGTLTLGGLGAREGARALASWPRARRLAAGADVVYLNGTVCGRLLPALRGARTVLHVHDLVARCPRMWRRAAVVLADSDAVAKRLPGLDAHVVHCPVELHPAPVAAPWPDDGRPVVGFVGRIEPRKGPLDLVAAAPAIHAARPDVRVVIVGGDPYGGDPDYVEGVRGSHEVEHYGWVPGAAGLMRHFDVLVAPSRAEPFGTVLAEAMAVGTPVVATRVGGVPEVVPDGRAGVLVAPGAPAEIAAAALRVLEHREEMGREARNAAQRFDADAYADRVEALIAPPGAAGAAAPASSAGATP